MTCSFAFSLIILQLQLDANQFFLTYFDLAAVYSGFMFFAHRLPVLLIFQ